MGGIGLMELEGTPEFLTVPPLVLEMGGQSGGVTCFKSHSQVGAEWPEAKAGSSGQR